MTLADIPEARAAASRFGVAADIHADDFVFRYRLDVNPGADRDEVRAQVADYYFADGADSAARLDDLVRRFHPAHARRRLALLEFASGYGRVSRHLKKLDDRYDLTASDIHPQAIAFLAGTLGVAALPSASDPADFAAPPGFDVVFALSFFSHVPQRTWGRWLAALYDRLAEDGLLIFTTHGRLIHIDMKLEPLDPSGCWFYGGLSEQKDLPAEEYGVTVASPIYVIRQIERCPRAALACFEEGYWWTKQDLYVIRKPRALFIQPRPPPPAAPDGDALARQAQLAAEAEPLRAALAAMHASRSWRLTAPLRRFGRLLGGHRTG